MLHELTWTKLSIIIPSPLVRSAALLWWRVNSEILNPADEKSAAVRSPGVKKYFSQIQKNIWYHRFPTSAIVARLAGALVVVAAAVAGLALEVAGKLAHVAASVVARVAVADVLVIALKMTTNIKRYSKSFPPKALTITELLLVFTSLFSKNIQRISIFP